MLTNGTILIFLKKNNAIKIMQISDLHFETLQYFYISIADKINQIQPDLVLITGDSVNYTE